TTSPRSGTRSRAGPWRADKRSPSSSPPSSESYWARSESALSCQWLEDAIPPASGAIPGLRDTLDRVRYLAVEHMRVTQCALDVAVSTGTGKRCRLHFGSWTKRTPHSLQRANSARSVATVSLTVNGEI